MSDALAPVFAYSDARLEHAMASGEVNVTDDAILANIRSAIRRGHPQIAPCAPKPDRVCVVGSGPSLNDTVDELRQLYFEGAKIVTMNGAYQWCLERNFRPSTQIVLDARASNARFLQPAVPQCRYLLASQCAPELWDAVEGREHVWIFHSHIGEATDTPIGAELDGYYGKGYWCGVGGGVTVATRAIVLLRMLGYLRFDLFGVDCCWLDGQHHAFPQPENEHDRRMSVQLALTDTETDARTFTCSPWQLKQLENFIHLVKMTGDDFLLNVHGDGMLAHAFHLAATAGWDGITPRTEGVD
jgi:hypothetical protein